MATNNSVLASGIFSLTSAAHWDWFQVLEAAAGERQYWSINMHVRIEASHAKEITLALNARHQSRSTCGQCDKHVSPTAHVPIYHRLWESPLKDTTYKNPKLIFKNDNSDLILLMWATRLRKHSIKITKSILIWIANCKFNHLACARGLKNLNRVNNS